MTDSLVEQARDYYAKLGVRADHPGARSFGDYFDRFWFAQGRRHPENDSPEEQRGYDQARRGYVKACALFAKNDGARVLAARSARVSGWARRETRRGRLVWGVRAPEHVVAPHVRIHVGPRPRGAGRPGCPARRGGDSGDSGDSSHLDDDDGDKEPGENRALLRARALSRARARAPPPLGVAPQLGAEWPALGPAPRPPLTRERPRRGHAL